MKTLKSLAIISMLVLTCAYGVAFAGNVDKQEAKKSDTKEKNCGAKVDTADMRYEKSPLNKLGRGAINAVTCLVEMPAGIYRVSKDKGELVGLTLGLAEGMVTSVLRMGSGLFDMVTFIIPPYNKPLMQPEYALDSFGESFHELDDVMTTAPNI